MTRKLLPLAMAMGLLAGAGCTWKLGGNEQTAPPTITSVDPALGNNTQDVDVTVLGTGFFRLLVRDLNDATGYRADDTYRVTVGGVEARNVVRVDDEHLSLTIPAGLPEGPHDVVATSPAGLVAFKAQAYYATPAEPPLLTDISPPAAVNDAAQVIAVSGTGFRPGAQLFIAPGSLPVVELATATPLADDPAGTPTPTQRPVIVPAGLQPGPYTLAVRNPDGQRAHLRDVLRVVGPASLSLALAAPAQVSVGQAFNISATVDNGGGSAATQVTLDPPATQGSGALSLGAPTPSAVTVAAGAAGTIDVPAQATQPGLLTVSTRAAGQNEFSQRAVASATVATQQLRIQQPAALTASLATSPAATASVGQTVTVTLQVRNTGEADAVGVAPSALVLTGSGAATLASGPTPASATIAGGTSASFTFTYTASAPGSVVFTGTAQGRDGNSQQVVSSAAAASSALSVQTAAELSIISFAVPATVARGQTFTATMVVANVGQAEATAVLPVPSPPAKTTTGGADAATSTALSPVNIPGGGSATFTWSYQESGTSTGTLAFSAQVAGTDANSGSRVSSPTLTTNTASVQQSSDLRVISFDIPAIVTTGQTFSATMTVQNFGGTTASGVLPTPNPPTLTATGGAGATTSSTVLPATIPPAGTATFVWSYTVTGTGTISFSAGATGTDTATGGTVNAPNAPSNVATVIAPSGLTISSFSIPTSVSRGQTFTATMVVRNNGGADALNVLPDPPTVTPTGGAGAVTSTTFTPQTIPPGGTATFNWSYGENGTGPGTLQLSAGASGTDSVTMNPVTANATSTNLAQVQEPGRLQVDSFTLPGRLSRAQAFTATLVVRNLGQASVTSVLPAPLPPTLTRTGGANATTATSFTPQTIPGGGTATFAWSYAENGTGPGTLQLNAGATGADANSLLAVSAPPVDSPVATVESPPALAVTAVNLPARLSRGQTFTAEVLVSNTGQATALQVLPSPNPPTLTATGGAGAATMSTPAAQDIPAGQTGRFVYLYQENGSGVGTLALATGASGTDANSGQTVTGASRGSAAAAVEAPSALAVTSFTVPPTLSRTSTFTVTMVVANTGQATARGVLPAPNPPTLTSTGRANAATTTTLTAQDIPGGGTATFAWTYQETGTGTGSLRFSAGAGGTDGNSGQTVTAASQTSNTATVQDGAALSVTSFLAPGTISRGQTFTATMVVTNVGGATANGVLPSPNPPTVSATGGAGAATSAALTPATILPGGTATFSWSFNENGTGPGTLALSAGATGTDSNSGQTVSAPTATTNTVNVQTPPSLVVTGIALPATLSRGQAFQVAVTVANQGGATAVGVVPSPSPPTLTRGGSANAATASTATPATIPGGGSATFTYSYAESGTGAGTLRFSAGAQGQDANSLATVTAPAASSPTATVQTPASLAITTFTIPANISRGQTFTATLVVSNTGQAAANVALPSPNPPTLTVTGAANATPTTSVTPVTIPGGGTATFAWSYLENGAGTGTLRLRAGASGTDANSGAAVSAAAVDSTLCNVQNPGTLQVTSFTIPATLTRGQTFTATMTVRNTGTLVVNNVLPAPNPPTLARTGAANAVTSTALTPVNNLAPGASATFTWTYLETGAGTGTITLTAGAVGVDANMAPVSANATSTNLAQVQTAPSLTVSAFTLPARLSRGQSFQAVMVVTNTGQATATGVLPSPNPPTKTLTGGANAATATALTPAAIPGGGSATFTYSYTESGTGPGTIALAAGAQGQDANTTSPVSAPQLTSNVATVEAPAALSITSFTAPATISRGQAFTLRMTVQNTGQATANSVLPTPNPPTLTSTGSANATTSTVLSPVSIAGGSSHTFVWTHTENGAGPGTLSFAGAAQGTDANSSGTVTSPAATSNTVTVQTPPTLAVSFTVPPRVSRGQTFTAVVTVTNSGQATATGVVPAPNPPNVTRTGQAQASSTTIAPPAAIPGGGSATFTYSYAETGNNTGTLTLSAGAAGTDANSGGAVSAPAVSSSAIVVQTPASLAVTSLTLPARLSRGQMFTGTMTVSNSGQADAVMVAPQPDPPSLVLTGGANATTATTQVPLTVPGGGSRTFSWAFLESGTGSGTLALRGGASGSDANSGAALTAAPLTSAAAQVESPAQLAVASFTIPSGLSSGQAFQAVMVVTNTGQATANGVLPSPNPPTKTLTGQANATTATALTPATIAGGASATFTWAYTEGNAGPGTLQLTAAAAGTDANAGTTITAPATSTAVATVQARAALTSSLAGPPAAVAGDQFVVTMTVTNTGGATASNVTPSALTPTVTGAVSLSLLSSPAPASIAGGGSATFSWTYSTTAASNGTARFTGSAAGTDANSGAAVTSPSSSSGAIVIVPPATAGLVSAITTRPRSIPVGDTVTVELSVNNRTGGTLSGVRPSALTLGGTGQVALVSGPVPATFNLLAGQTQLFTWTYQATASGWVTFTGNAVSTTPANASARTTSPALAIPSPRCHLSTLVVSAGPDRTITCNQNAALGGSPTASGGNPSYVYEWTPTANVSNPAFANPTASPRSTGTVYTVKVTDGDGCQLSDSMVVTVSNAPVITSLASGQPDDRRCTGQNFALSRTFNCPAGGCNTAWTHGDGTNSNAGNHNKAYSAAGTYVVTATVTDGNTCRATASLPVFVGTAGTFPIGRMTLTPSAPSVAADGASTLTFSSQPLVDCAGTLAGPGSGMRFLVMTDRGTITTADTDNGTAGIQVGQSAVAGGHGLNFTVRADRAGGPVRVRAQSVLPANGNARGWGTAAFTGSSSLPQVMAAAAEGLTAVNPTRVGAAFTKAMGAATVTGASVSLQEIGGGTCANPTGPAVAGTSSYQAATRAAVFSPSAALDVLTRSYVMRLTAALQDTFTNPLDGNFNGNANGTPQDDYRFCFGDLPDTAPPTLSCTSLLPGALSPDGDGTGDTSTLAVSLADDVGLKSWRVEVRSEATGAVVRTLSKPRATSGNDTLAWDGRDEWGQVAPNGSYQLSASALDTSDNRSAPCSLGLTISSVLDSPELSPP